jgi:hypothetical protein
MKALKFVELSCSLRVLEIGCADDSRLELLKYYFTEADRCLCNNGYLIIKDFLPPFPYKKAYIHYDGISSYKMDYSLMFKLNPVYTEIYSVINSHPRGISQP